MTSSKTVGPRLKTTLRSRVSVEFAPRSMMRARPPVCLPWWKLSDSESEWAKVSTAERASACCDTGREDGVADQRRDVGDEAQQHPADGEAHEDGEHGRRGAAAMAERVDRPADPDRRVHRRPLADQHQDQRDDEPGLQALGARAQHEADEIGHRAPEVELDAASERRQRARPAAPHARRTRRLAPRQDRSPGWSARRRRASASRSRQPCPGPAPPRTALGQRAGATMVTVNCTSLRGAREVEAVHAGGQRLVERQHEAAGGSALAWPRSTPSTRSVTVPAGRGDAGQGGGAPVVVVEGQRRPRRRVRRAPDLGAAPARSRATAPSGAMNR